MKANHTMRALVCAAPLAAACLMLQAAVPPSSAELSSRVELRRADLSPSTNMEVISSLIEFKPGSELPRHSHHGVESGYVLEGGLIQRPGKEPEMLATGTPILNLRDAVHGGYRIVGDKSIRIFTVHVVDKDKPLYEYVK